MNFAFIENIRQLGEEAFTLLLAVLAFYRCVSQLVWELDSSEVFARTCLPKKQLSPVVFGGGGRKGGKNGHFYDCYDAYMYVENEIHKLILSIH